jgi:hypothetical protein
VANWSHDRGSNPRAAAFVDWALIAKKDRQLLPAKWDG